MQLNPPQFAAAAALCREHAETTVVLNHMGCPTFDDLSVPAQAQARPTWQARTVRALRLRAHRLMETLFSPLACSHAHRKTCGAASGTTEADRYSCDEWWS